ncbi:hypothetical protein QTP88_008214 [Uroleucon formosanum]
MFDKNDDADPNVLKNAMNRDLTRSITRIYTFTNYLFPKQKYCRLQCYRRCCAILGYRWKEERRSPGEVIMFGIQFGGKTKAIPLDSCHDHWGNQPPEGFLIVIKISPSSGRLPALPHGNVREIILQSLFIIGFSSVFHSRH